MRVAVARSSTAQRLATTLLAPAARNALARFMMPSWPAKTTSSCFTSRKYDDVSVQPGSPDLACLPKTVFRIRPGRQHQVLRGPAQRQN